MSHYDIIIVGSGIVGAVAALALAKKTSLRIAILDAQSISTEWKKEKYDHRVSAISLASQRIFESLNVWEKIQNKRCSAYQKMFVWDAESSGEIHFDSASIKEHTLGHIIEDSVMRTSLYEMIQQHPQIDFLYPVTLTDLQIFPDRVELKTNQEKHFTASLILAADGANSWVRDRIQTSLKTHDYEHVAIVTTVKTELPHQATAWQRFLSTGPLAFLPLENPHFSSIVWSTQPEHAQQLLEMTVENFQKELAESFAHKLGNILSVEQRYSFPLRMRHAKNYVQPRVALLGDAAHTIHPLAGQGVNLGLLDAVFLADVVAETCQKNRDFASFSTLRRYERARKADNLAMLAMVDSLKILFTKEKKTWKTLRGTGLNIVNQWSFLKKMLIHHAVGNRSDLPSLATISNE